MKQHYPKVPFFLIFFALLLYELPSAFSQCTCSMGAAPNEIKHTVVLNPVISSNLTITFPKFDPSIGTLSCIRFEDSVSIQSSLGVRNLDTVDKSYRFRLSVTTDITGPSFTVNDFRDVIYGPDPLGAFGTATDSINYGPDTVYNNVGHQTYTSNVINKHVAAQMLLKLLQQNTSINISLINLLTENCISGSSNQTETP